MLAKNRTLVMNMKTRLMNSVESPLAIPIVLYHPNIENFFSMAASGEAFPSMLKIKNVSGMPVPKLNAYFESLNRAEKKKVIAITVILTSIMVKLSLKNINESKFSNGNIVLITIKLTKKTVKCMTNIDEKA